MSAWTGGPATGSEEILPLRGRIRQRWRWSPAVTLARAVALLAPTAYLLLLVRGGLDPGWVLLGLLGLAVNRWPDGPGPLAVWSTLVALWWVAGPADVWSTLPAAIVLLLAHAATAFIAGAPDDAAAGPVARRRWSLRLLAVAGLTSLVALAVAGVGAWGRPGTVWVSCAALLGLTGLLLLLRSGGEQEP